MYLRKAVIVGAYEDDAHYLDVLFRLMREDLYRPLRDGIRQYRESGGRGRQDLYVYANVRIVSWELHKTSGQMLHYLTLNTVSAVYLLYIYRLLSNKSAGGLLFFNTLSRKIFEFFVNF